MALEEYRKQVANLSVNEQKLRDLHLRKLALGEIQGPPTGYASLDKPWLKFYPEKAILEDVPNIKAYDYIVLNNSNHLNDVALSYLGKDITYKSFFKEVDNTVRALRNKGIKEGDVVTMAMATTPEMVYTLYALNRIGAVANMIDPRLKKDEIIQKVNESNSKMFIGLGMSVEKIADFIDETTLSTIITVSPFESSNPIIKLLGKTKLKEKETNSLKWKKFLNDGKNYSGVLDSAYVPNQPAVILYTGGTTGAPKGVVLTNENLNTMAFTQLYSDFILERNDTFLNFLPPFSAYSIVNAVHDPLVLGFKTILVPMFTPEDFPKLMAKYKPNHVLSGPILWDLLMRDRKYSNINLSFLKSPISGGDSLSLEMEKNINDYLKKQGCKYKLQQGYGMTEVSAAACYSSEKSYSPGSVGVPYVKNNVSVFDHNTGEELITGSEGEIKISTPTMMKEYHNNDKATAEVIAVDKYGQRWISTGDIGKVGKNGNVFLVGRIKRMIVRAGNKIFPSNIENLLLSIDGIEQCSIVGMPDKEDKSAPIAHIVLKTEFVGKEKEIVNEIKRIIPINMPEFNVPKKFVFRDNLPLTDMSKVNFKQLEHESLDLIDISDEIIIISHEKAKQLSLKK